LIQFAHVVLLCRGLYVLQHRDDKPGIAAPGQWALFGGRVEEPEDPLDAAVREVKEELDVSIGSCELFWHVERYSEFTRSMAHYVFFEADITRQWGSHRLMEGQGVERFAYHALAALPMFPVMREVLDRHHAFAMGRL
jgi:8-oxo-dGTP pyrophosphatase MutT (NUDIX family)